MGDLLTELRQFCSCGFMAPGEGKCIFCRAGDALRPTPAAADQKAELMRLAEAWANAAFDHGASETGVDTRQRQAAAETAFRTYVDSLCAAPGDGMVRVPRAALESFLKTADALDNIVCAGLERVSFPVQDVRALRNAIAAAPAAGAERRGEDAEQLGQVAQHRLTQINRLTHVIEQVNAMACYGCEEDTSAARDMLSKIGDMTRAIAAGATPTPDATITSTVERCAQVAERLPDEKDGIIAYNVSREIARRIRALAPRSDAPAAGQEGE